MKPIATVLSVAFFILLACVASERKVDTPPPIRVDTTATDPNASVQSNVRPLTNDEALRLEANRQGRAAVLDDWKRSVATDTAQPPYRRAEVRRVAFAAPALPTPILDVRVRECISYPLTAGFAKVRYNLLLQPNLYEVTIRNWSDPEWLATFRVEGGMFPVNLWRIRNGEAAFWKHVWVQAGPGLPTGNPQVALSADFFRGGDDLCIEAGPRVGGAVLVAYDQQTGQVVQPQLSQIQNSSNDSTPIPGAWTTIGGAE